MEDARLFRDLLDANLRLTEQVCEMARLAIGAPVRSHVAGAPMQVPESVPPQDFAMTTDDDWEDIPEGSEDDIATAALFNEAIRPSVRTLQLVQPQDGTVERELPGYMTEEEEDLRWQVAMGQKPPAHLQELLDKLSLPDNEMTMTLE